VNLANLDSRALDFQLKYLKQFSQLIPSRIEAIETCLNKNDRVQLRKEVHAAKPQILFFGISQVKSNIEKIEQESETMQADEMIKTVSQLSQGLRLALEEVNSIVTELS
jgi:hypothetical protein